MDKKSKNNKKYIFTGIIAIVLIIIIVLILLLSCNRSYNVELDVDSKLYYQATIRKGDTLRDIKPPTKKGYVFVGWYVDGEKFDLDTPITGDIKLEARWEKSAYTVTFDFDNGRATSKVEVEAKGKVARPATPTKLGFNFLGWFVGDKEFDFNTEITEDVTITAKWSEITIAKYTVEHYLMGTDGKYSNTPADRDVYIGTIGTTASPNVKTYKGFTSPKVESKTILKNDATVIKYYYTRNKYTLTLEGDIGVIETDSDGTYYYGETVKLNYTIKEGYSVDRFSEEVKDGVYVMGDEDVTITLTTTPNTDTKYTVKHYVMGTDGEYPSEPDYVDNLTGTTDTTVTAKVKELGNGFVIPTEEEVTITGDGEAVIEYKYERRQFTLTLTKSDTLGAGIESLEGDGTYYYGAKVKVKALIKEGYTFVSWDPANVTETEFDYEITASDTTLTASATPNTDTKYTVKHYIMGTDGEYPTEPDYVDNLTGTTDTVVTAKVRDLGSGFIIPSEEEVTITGDGKAVIEYRYERRQFTLTLTKSATLGAGIESLEGDGKYYYGAKVKVKALIKEGYTFVSWDPVNVTETEFDYEIPSSNIILIASATPNTDTRYTVKHYIMGTDGEYPTEPDYVDNLTGTTDTIVTAKVKDLGNGFVIPTEEEVTITGDGKAVVEYRYERRQFTLTLEKSVYASSAGIESLEGDGLYYYGQSVVVTANVKEGYTFTSWQPVGVDKNTFTYVMPAANMTLTAGVKPNTDTKYTVKHYVMKPDGKYPTEPDYTDNLTGTTDTTVTAKVRKLGEGFIIPSEEKVTITGDGKAVVEYRYARKQFTLTLTPGTGIASVDGNGLHYYGESVTVTANVKEGYTFETWQPGNIDKNTFTYVMPASDATLTASAIPNSDTEYTIEYYLMGTDGSYPAEPSITKKQTGTTDTTVVVKPEDLGKGFKTPRVSSVTITGDGKAVVKFQYERNKFTLRFATRSDFVPTEESYNIMINDTIDYYKTLEEDIEKLKFYYGENVKIEVTMGDGIHFDTWEISSVENKNNAVINYKMPASDANLPFRLAINKYTIMFNGKGGITSDRSETYTQENVKYSIKNNYPTLKENLFTRKGYDFTGWSKNDDNTPDPDITLVDGSYKLSDNLTAENGVTVPLYACWQIKENSVDFNLNYPNAPQSGVYETYEDQQYGEQITRPSHDPTREGYKFDNWYKDTEGNTVWNFDSDTMGEVGLQLYAKWTPINYNLEYHYDNGIDSEPLKETATYDKAITLKGEPNNKKQFNVTYNKKNDEGATTEQITGRFVCWTIDGVCASEKMQDGVLKNLTTTEDGTVELHAKWEYTLTLNNSVTKTGYHLDGWSLTDSGNKIDDNGTYDKDVNLYALWLINKANVTYHSNNGEDKTVKAEFTYGSESFANNDFTKQYTITYYNEDNVITTETINLAFKEWLKDSDKGSSYTVKALNKELETNNGFEVNLYASWEDKEVTLKTSEDKEISSTTKTGYKLTGWSLEKNGEPVGKTYKVTSDLKLYAVWTPIKYKVKFDANTTDVKGSMTEQEFTYDGEKNTLASNGFTKDGYHFMGWSTDKSTVKYSDGATVKDNLASEEGQEVTLYAVWEVNKAHVTYHSNNGEDKTVKADFAYGNDAFATNSFTKQYTITYYNGDSQITTETVNLTIKEWLKDSNKGSSYTAQNLNEELKNRYDFTVDLYASWEDKEVTLKTSKDIPTTKTGYKLTGWSLNKNGVSVGEKYKVTSDLNLYAVWTPIKYKVKFDANATEVNGSMNAQDFTYDGKENKLATNGFTRDGYHFMGWSTDKSDGTVDYGDGVTVNDNLASEEGKEVTLYAVWEVNKVNITYHENNGTTNKTEAHEFTYGSESFATVSGFSKNVTIHYDYRAGSELSNKDNDKPFVIKCWSKDKKTCYDVTTLNASTEFKNNTIEAFDLYALWQVPLDVPTREDYVFGGWTTESNIPSKLEDSFLKDNILGYTTTDFEPEFTGQYKYAEASDFDKETTLHAVWWDIPYISSVSFQLGKVAKEKDAEPDPEFDALPDVMSPDIKVGHLTGKKKTAIYVRFPETTNYYVHVFTLSVGVTQPIRLNLLSGNGCEPGDIFATNQNLRGAGDVYTEGVGFGYQKTLAFPFAPDEKLTKWSIPWDNMKRIDPSVGEMEGMLDLLKGNMFASLLSIIFLGDSPLGVANRFGCNGLACSPHYTSMMYAGFNTATNGFAGPAINGYTYYFMATDDAIADPYTLTYQDKDGKVIYSFQVPRGTPIPDIGLTGTDQEGAEFSVTGWQLNGKALDNAVAEGSSKTIVITGTQA